MIIKILPPEKNHFTLIGVMSGTSLDGLDLVLVNFKLEGEKWTYKLLKNETIKYSSKTKEKLANSRKMSGEQLSLLDVEFGNLIGDSINTFIQKNQLEANKIHAIASHGHTVFHQVEKGLTLQIGNGHAISTKTNLPCINDFRQKDVCLGGQGAPLVPIGDLFLFKEYAICLNLGGIANASFKEKERIVSYDLAPMNLSLNYLANKLNKDYDRDGEIAQSGSLNPQLLDELNALSFYKKSSPKSLGIEWLDTYIFKLIDQSILSVPDLMRTFCEHQAYQIALAIEKHAGETILITGGGAFNLFFIESLKKHTNKNVIIPENTIIEFKEALIFAFLGALYLNSSFNVLSSVTGSTRNSVSGALYLPY